ncbi:hypothetical protein [Croceicoccus pelagius]|uniref:Uncharacterized protein n=1 Tax=Croceicoccus pelagius TaxID=1703341 RepID=A0A917DN29_9SPHN|nr:hypothetical protein [Croceicoccus pelagius]GGD54686.1 hypothetical protein GCM10010989_31080 [Croceicoccus pelagius]
MDGIHFTYRYTALEDEVEREGEAYAALEDGKLYLVAFEAPSLYYFDKDVKKFHEVVRTLEIRD